MVDEIRDMFIGGMEYFILFIWHGMAGVDE
jgi:hypothetical protein